MLLRPLTLADEPPFLAALATYPPNDPTPFSFLYTPGMPFDHHLALLDQHARGLHLPENRVPSTMLYAFLETTIVGRVSIRHRLNDFLRHTGGHVGFTVAPPHRRRGHATEMLRLALPYCQALGLTEIMLTYDESNTASAKVIEKNGGRLVERYHDTHTNTPSRRYTIMIAPTPPA